MYLVIPRSLLINLFFVHILILPFNSFSNGLWLTDGSVKPPKSSSYMQSHGHMIVLLIELRVTR